LKADRTNPAAQNFDKRVKGRAAATRAQELGDPPVVHGKVVAGSGIRRPARARKKTVK